MDQQPKIPTLKDAQKPQVKIKGLGAGLTLFDRLKHFKKKDLAFILAGLGTLFMAPLAEHFLMAPEGGDASLQQGWGKGGAGNFFGGGGSPYENGNNGIASGGAIGGGGDIITPLNVRDPSALVMGPAGTQQPPAGSAAPATPPASARGETDYKDALAGAASRAASAAMKKAPLPVPKVALGGSGLRGLGAASGGSSAGSGSLGPISSGNLGRADAGGGGLNMVRSTPGFRGAAGARSPTGGTGLDETKKAAADAGDAFSRTGSAMSGLNAAASEAIPTGGQGYGGGGQGGSGANDKPGGGSGAGGSKSVGESLAYLERKLRMEENLKLEFEKKKLWDNSLLMGNIRNDFMKAAATKVGEDITKKVLTFLDPKTYSSDTSIPGFKCGANMDWYPEGGDYCMTPSGNLGTPGKDGCDVLNSSPGPAKCTNSPKSGKADAAGSGKTITSATTPMERLYGASNPSVVAGLDDACAKLDSLTTSTDDGTNVRAAYVSGEQGYYTQMKTRGAALVYARSYLTGEGSPKACGAGEGAVSDSVAQLQEKAFRTLIDQLPGMSDLVVQGEEGDSPLQSIDAEVEKVWAGIEDAGKKIKAASTSIETGSTGGFNVFPGNPNQLALDVTGKLTAAATDLKRTLEAMVAKQKQLDDAFAKAKDIVHKEGTLKGVIDQNQNFAEMKAAIVAKGKQFPDTWGKLQVREIGKIQAGGGVVPSKVVTATQEAKDAIAKVCGVVEGFCSATSTAGSDPEVVKKVEPLLAAPPIKVGEMRQMQGSAISQLSDELTKASGLPETGINNGLAGGGGDFSVWFCGDKFGANSGRKKSRRIQGTTVHKGTRCNRFEGG